jgi:hypothetical protein
MATEILPDDLLVSISYASVSQFKATVGAPCYPPAVNYTPLYFLINGVAFNKTNAMRMCRCCSVKSTQCKTARCKLR